MNYIHKLKLATKEHSDSILTDEIRSKCMTIVEIGVIIKPSTFDETGTQLTPDTVVEGWHVDVLAKEIIEELREYCLDHAPANPKHGYGWGYTRDNLGNVIAPILVFKEGELQL